MHYVNDRSGKFCDTLQLCHTISMSGDFARDGPGLKLPTDSEEGQEHGPQRMIPHDLLTCCHKNTWGSVVTAFRAGISSCIHLQPTHIMKRPAQALHRIHRPEVEQTQAATCQRILVNTASL